MKLVKNILFDFGGVFLNIDFAKTYEAFKMLGISDFSSFFDGYTQTPLFEDLETGKITPADFADGIRQLSGLNVTDEQIFTAWNALLLDLPAIRVAVLKRAAFNYRVFLLSNTNQIHYEVYNGDFRQLNGYDFENLFEKAYWSHRIGMRKPNPEVFREILLQNNLRADETVFIDDGIMHIEAAKALGFNVIHLHEKDVTELFDQQGRLIY